jgi:nucleotide-binding universal stress UspA family protein
MEKLKVLIPTDFSVQAEYAFILVNRLQSKLPMEIHFLHVLNFPETVTMDSFGNISTCGEIDAGYVTVQRDLAANKLAALKAQYGNEVSTHSVVGRTTHAIVDFAEGGKFDLIAMGTKGAWGLKERLSGTETQHVARKTSVPVLSLMCDRSDLEIQHFLLVHDFTDSTDQELSLMKKLQTAFHANLHFLQIIKNEDDITRVKQAMEDFANRHGLTNYEKHTLKDTDVESGVIHFNQMNAMDIICIGTHQKGGIFHSSATEKLINHLFKPIISFHLN